MSPQENSNVSNLQQPAPEPKTFQESLVMQMQKNRVLIQEQINTLEHKLDLCDEVIDLINQDTNISVFAQKMAELQAGVQQ